MSATTSILLALYLGGVLWLGFLANRKSRATAEDFFLANRGVGLWLLVGTIVATVVNGLAVTGTPALFYEGGVLFGQLFIAVFGSVALMWVFGPRVCELARQRRFVTQGEMFADNYRSPVILALTAGVGIVSVFPFLAIQLAGIGKVVETTTESRVPQEAAVLLCALSVGIYVFLGGARAAVWTDAIQGLIALGVFAGSAILFSVWVGGIPMAVDRLEQVMPDQLVFNAANAPLFVDGILSWTFAFFLWPHIFKRMFMARTARSVRRSAVLSLVVFSFILISLLTMTITATAELYGELDDPDQLIATMFTRYLPVGGVFLMILVFALAMSTIDSMLLALGSIISRDVWEGLLGHEQDTRADFVHGRWLTLAFLALATLFALTAVGRGALIPWVTLGASIATVLLWPFVGMFVWNRASAARVVVAMCLALVAIFAARFTQVGMLLPFGFATAGFLVGAVSFILGGLIMPPARTQVG